MDFNDFSKRNYKNTYMDESFTVRFITFIYKTDRMTFQLMLTLKIILFSLAKR